VQPPGGRSHGVFEAARQTSPTHEMAVGHLDAPSVTDGTKDFGPVLVAWGLVPSHSANFVVEFVRESLGRRLRSAPVNEHELQSFVRARAGEVVEYLFDGTGLGGRSGDDSHAEWQARDVDADDPFGAVGPTVGAALVVKGHTSVRSPRARCVSITTIEGRGSFRPSAVRDEACRAARTRLHVPFFDHRRNWDHTLVQGPNSSGRKRHWHPVCEM